MRKITEGSADEIFNALGHCYNGVCGGCPYAPKKDCLAAVQRDAYKLVKYYREKLYGGENEKEDKKEKPTKAAT